MEGVLSTSQPYVADSYSGSQSDGRKAPEVTFLVTHGEGSLDLYSEKLAEHLPVRKIETEAYKNGAELFGAPLLSVATARALRGEASFAWKLRGKDSLLHLPNHHCGRYGRFCRQPYVITVHDLMRIFDASSSTPLIQRPSLQERVFLRLDAAGIRRAAGIIAVSQATRKDLERYLRIPKSRIAVVYEGVDHALFRPVDARPFDFPYLLYVGSEQPRKNLATLLRAFAHLKRERGFADLKLVKVGAPGGNGNQAWRGQTLRAVRELGLDREVVFTERCTEEALPAYYSGAEVFILPSFYEGFGLPPLEAMACGCPVIVSNRGALSETAGPGALVVDPCDPLVLATAIESLLRDDANRATLVRRGFQHAQKFSWRRCATETVEAYERFL
jgi:glycosyltransferase involved in cell wall biosynthesis